MNTFESKYTTENLAALRKSFLAITLCSQKHRGAALALMRLSPRALKEEYSKREFLKNELGDDKKNLWKYNSYSVRYDETGRGMKPTGDKKIDGEDNFTDFDGMKMTGDPWINMKTQWKKWILPIFSYENELKQIVQHDWKRCKQLIKFIFGETGRALCIESRAVMGLIQNGRVIVDGEETPMSQINPMLRDLIGLNPLENLGVNARQKGTLSLALEYFQSEGGTAASTQNFNDLVGDIIKGRVGNEAGRIILNMDPKRAFRTLNSFCTVIRNVHTPLVSPDLTTLSKIVREGKNAVDALCFIVTGVESKVPGFCFTKAEFASAYKSMCMTGEIYTPFALEFIPRHAEIQFAKGEQSSVAEFKRTKYVWVETSFNSGKSRGAEAGFNPDGGRNCTDEVFNRLSKTAVGMLSDANPSTVAGMIAEREKKNKDSTMTIAKADGSKEKVTFAFDVFFHTKLPTDAPPPPPSAERVKERQERKEAMKDKSKSKKGKAKRTRKQKPYGRNEEAMES